MHELYNLKEDLVKELENIGKQGVSKSNIEMVDKLAHAAKNVAKVIECCDEDNYSSRGYSRRMSYDDGRSYAHEDYVRPDGSYRDGGMAYARGRGAGAKRDSMGRYSSEGSVDEHTKEELRKLIERM